MPFISAETRKEGGGAGYKQISPSYFATIGLTIVRGRGLDDGDRKGSTPAIVVNQQFADQFFPGRDPLGQHLLIQEIIPGQPALGPEIPWEIVGIVSNEHAGGLGDHDGAGMYVSIEQGVRYGPSVVLRTSIDAAAIAEPLRAAIRSIDPDQVVSPPRTISSLEDEYVAPNRLRTSLIAAFGAIALLLAAVGVYGVIAYSVSQRTSEIGLRMAIGASRRDIFRLVAAEGICVATTGIGVGLIAAIGVGKAMSSLIYGISVRDPATFIIATGLLLIVALAASIFPGARAARLLPMVALRHE